jgi:oxygen-dependent protoporphyrinogen oxidase
VAADGEVLLRVSMGRSGDGRFTQWDDEELVARAWSELGTLMGVTGSPLETTVARFPDAFPQYRVHHLLRTSGIESAVTRLGGLAVAGAAYRGVGIPACIASGRLAARAVL